MAAITSAAPVTQEKQKNIPTSHFWLRDKRWDLMFITLSVIVVPLPYLSYLFGRDVIGIEDDVIRNMVNIFVAVAIGGSSYDVYIPAYRAG